MINKNSRLLWKHSRLLHRKLLETPKASLATAEYRVGINVKAAKAEKINWITYGESLSVINNGQSAAKGESQGSTTIIGVPKYLYTAKV